MTTFDKTHDTVHCWRIAPDMTRVVVASDRGTNKQLDVRCNQPSETA